jgi:hypothetical protein
MKTRTRKLRNDLALRTPKRFAELVESSARSAVEDATAISLAELVRRITPENRHSTTETGQAVGCEIW